MNSAARACGVRKHMRPEQAAALLSPCGGHLVHAFWRKWPGPRVNYRPYQAASRRLFAALDQALAEADAQSQGSRVTVERASVDECFVDVSALCGGSLMRGRQLAAALQESLRRSSGFRVTAGCARNRLLAKLASSAAKSRNGGGRVLAVLEEQAEPCSRDGTAEAVPAGEGFTAQTDLLRGLPATKLPGLGGKGPELAALGASTIADLQRSSVEDLAAALGLAAEAALRAWRGCRGLDEAPVCPSPPPKSLVVTSWTTHTALRDIARREHTGRGGAAVPVGSGWVFEAHEGSGRSNETRARWILLSMAIDLVDKAHLAWLDWAVLPTRLSVSWHGCGKDPLPGPGMSYLSGESRSRTVALPAPAQDCFRALGGTDAAAGGGARAGGPLDAGGVYVPARRTLTDEGPGAMEDPAFRGCVAAVVDAAAGVLQQFVQEDAARGVDRRIAQLTVSLSRFAPPSLQRGIAAWAQHPRPGAAPSAVGSPRERPASCGAGAEPPAGSAFDEQVWRSLPDEIRRELGESAPLRRRQHGAAAQRGPRASAAPRRAALKRVGKAPRSRRISEFFKPQGGP